MGRIILDMLYIFITLILITCCWVKGSISDGEFVIALMINYGLNRFLSVTNEFTIEEVEEVKDNKN